MGSPKRNEYILTQIKETDSVLDIGCVQHTVDKVSKASWLHRNIVEKAKYTIGIDYVEEGVNHLKEQGLNVKCADAQNFDLNEKFDIVVAGEIIEHLENFHGFLNSIHKHLKEDGKVILTTPNVFLYNCLQSFKGDVKCHYEHTCWFDKRTVTQLLRRNKLEVDFIDYVEPPLLSYLPPLPFTGKNFFRNISYKMSWILFKLGFKMIGGQTMVIVAHRAK